MPPWPTNLDRARELLIEAGYNPTPGEPGGFSTNIWWNIPNAQREQVAEMTAFILAQLNIDVEIVAIEWAAFLAGTERGEQGMYILGQAPGTGDADNALWGVFHSTSSGAAGNRAFFGDPQVDALLEAARSELDPAQRLALYAEAQEIIRYQSPWVFIAQGAHLFATVHNLEGLVLNPAGLHNWTPVWFS